MVTTLAPSKRIHKYKLIEIHLAPEVTTVTPVITIDGKTPKGELPIFKFEDVWPRKVLGEGRNYGAAFALCLRTGDKIETVGPISPCKDYLNDQVYSEHSGKPYQAYGYKATKRGIFTDGNAYLAVAILPYFSGGEYPQQNKETKWLEENYLSVAKFLNQFEVELKLPTLTQVQRVADNRYIFVAPDFWCKWTYLVSLYSLLIRIAIESPYAGGDSWDYLNKCKTGDSMYAVGAASKMKKFIEGTIPPQEWSPTTYWHSNGISSLSLK